MRVHAVAKLLLLVILTPGSCSDFGKITLPALRHTASEQGEEPLLCPELLFSVLFIEGAKTTNYSA